MDYAPHPYGRGGRKPVSLMIKPVSGACNMRCRYCFYTDVMARRDTAIHPPMTTEILETVVRRAFQYADGPVSFAFQGGEPTLIGLPFYQELLRLERSYNVRGLSVRNAVQTNGLELSDEMIAFFAGEHFLLGLSIDGTQTIHDSLRMDPAGELFITADGRAITGYEAGDADDDPDSNLMEAYVPHKGHCINNGRAPRARRRPSGYR